MVLCKCTAEEISFDWSDSTHRLKSNNCVLNQCENTAEEVSFE